VAKDDAFAREKVLKMNYIDFVESAEHILQQISKQGVT
jgi:hypothetical protein